LIEDIRILSPAGVERAAQGWDRHAKLHGLQSIHEAEKAAIHAIEKADQGPAWDEVRRSLFGLTESGGALVSWKAEHGEIGHKAEDAAFMAALALIAHAVGRWTALPPAPPAADAALAENLVRAGHAACSYSWRTPPRRSRLRMLRWVIL